MYFSVDDFAVCKLLSFSSCFSQVTEVDKETLPLWLDFDQSRQTLLGVAGQKDIGQHYIEVTAIGNRINATHNAQESDVFMIMVIPEPPVISGVVPVRTMSQSGPQPVRCANGKPKTEVTIQVDADLDKLTPTNKIQLIKGLMKHLGLGSDMLKLVPSESNPLLESSTLVAGPGDVKTAQFPGAHLSWLVGCGKVEPDHMTVLQHLEVTAPNGEMASFLGHSIVGWHVTNTHFQEKVRTKRRAIKPTATPGMAVPVATQMPAATTKSSESKDTEDQFTRDVPSMESPTFTMVIQPTKAQHRPSKTTGRHHHKSKEPPVMHTEVMHTEGISLVTPTRVYVMPTDHMMTRTGYIEPSAPTKHRPDMGKTDMLPNRPTVIATKEMTDKPIVVTKTKSDGDPTKVQPEPFICPDTEEDVKPVLRNRVGTLVVMAGNVLKYRFPDDMFLDCKDGDINYLKVNVFTSDVSNIPNNYWLKLGPNSKSFTVAPMNSDIGMHSFIVVVVDSFGLATKDNFTINVQPYDLSQVNHEVSMTFDASYKRFNKKVQSRIDLSNKVGRLFGDSDASNMNILRIEHGSVILTWTNNSLPTASCPVGSIRDMVGKLMYENGTLKKEVINDLKPFKLMEVDVVPMGSCDKESFAPGTVVVEPTDGEKPYSVMPPIPDSSAEPEPTPEPTGETEPEGTKSPEQEGTSESPNDAKKSRDESDNEIWITTVVPAVVIVAILLLALLIACVLYRKRRKGKMSLEDKHTFVNKGVPVIFADELEERPNDSSKPLIMDQEKAPLPPPEYHRSSSESPRSTPPSDRRHDVVTADEVMEDESDVNSPLYRKPPPVMSSHESREPRPAVQAGHKKPPPYVPP